MILYVLIFKYSYIGIFYSCILVSKIYDISDYYYYDGQTVDKNRYTRTGGTGTLSYSNTGLKVTGTQSTIALFTNNVLTLPSSYILELTYVDGSNTQGSLYYGGIGVDDLYLDITQNFINVSKISNNYTQITTIDALTSGDVLKLEMDNGTMKISINDVLKTTQSITHTGQFFYRTYNGRNLTTKDLKVKPL